MNKKQTERILLAVVVTIMVLYGIYQVFYAKAYATNESSYKWGYSHPIYPPYVDEVCKNGHVTNETACDDGWYHVKKDIIKTLSAHASNERDYKIGFKDGEYDYKDCSVHNFCTNEENLYSTVCMPVGLIIGFIPKYVVGNQTACNHGYFHRWIHECLNDGGGALCVYQPGKIIIAGRTGPGTCYNTKKEGETCESGPMIPIGHH